MGWEGGEGAVSEVQETSRRSAVPEAREEIILGERSTLLTAAGSSKTNY